VKLVYLAGPYSAEYASDLWDNVMKARDWTKRLMFIGLSVFCPHLNSMFMDGYGGMDHARFMAIDKEILKRCDGVAVMAGWEDSGGTLEEIAFATELGLPVFYLKDGLDQLMDWQDAR
jgi:nucleoside 2-deoxyribosyltransferase